MQLAHLCDLYDKPAELVINSDQKGLPLVASDAYMRSEKGAVDVSTNGYGEERQLIVTRSNTASGHSLPPQVIYQGTPDRVCTPE